MKKLLASVFVIVFLIFPFYRNSIEPVDCGPAIDCTKSSIDITSIRPFGGLIFVFDTFAHIVGDHNLWQNSDGGRMPLFAGSDRAAIFNVYPALLTSLASTLIVFVVIKTRTTQAKGSSKE